MGVIILEMVTGKRLSALNAMYSDPQFQSDLQKVFESRLDSETAAKLADLLAPAYNPQPRNRPTDVAAWSEAVAQAFSPANPALPNF